MNDRKRILFFAEPATLAHVVRPVLLAAALDQDCYDVIVATGPDFRKFAVEADLKIRDLWAIGTRAYLKAVAAGHPVFPYSVLDRYVREDLRHIENVRPDLVVGDFRLSLAVSARLANVPYVAISNAYWSPFTPVHFEVPVHLTTRLLGPTVANYIFAILRPLIFAQHSLPMHRLRKKYGMPSLGFDLRHIFTEADLTLFADVPELVPTKDGGVADRYVYIGPITWTPVGSLPAALNQPADPHPLVYINLGSSGNPRLLQDIISAVVSFNARVAVATGGSVLRSSFPDGVVMAEFLPGGEVAARAKLVICNGGSPSTHQALQQGTPVLGIPANLDQLLNMQFIVACGAGLSLRGDQVSMERVRHLVQRLLCEPSFGQNAHRIANWFTDYSATERFAAVVRRMLTQGHA
ncbi:MAG: glycosyl transferase family 1 [Candidatus Contendobacter sp.]|nr:glycosyl transferase family 1 [Candidatus Contendobacter sp.]